MKFYMKVSKKNQYKYNVQLSLVFRIGAKNRNQTARKMYFFFVFDLF